MRGFFFGLSVSIAFIVGCVAGSKDAVLPPAEASNAAVEQRWAYFCFDEGDVDDVNFKANAAGARGWEMVAASAGSHGGSAIWCFRQHRP